MNVDLPTLTVIITIAIVLLILSQLKKENLLGLILGITIPLLIALTPVDDLIDYLARDLMCVLLGGFGYVLGIIIYVNWIKKE